MPKRQTPEELAQTQGFDIEYTVPYMGMLSQDPLARLGWDPSRHVYNPALGEGTAYGFSARGGVPASERYGRGAADYVRAAREYILKYRPDLANTLDVINLRPEIAYGGGTTPSYTPIHEARHVGYGMMLNKYPNLLGLGLDKNGNFEEALMRARDIMTAPTSEEALFALGSMEDPKSLGAFYGMDTEQLQTLLKNYEDRVPFEY
jgi:hypothetical protein